MGGRVSHRHAEWSGLALPYAHYTGCNLVAEGIEADFGWAREEGAYVGDGRPFLHVWNRLPCGCIIDATFAQCGDHTLQVNVASPDEPGYGDYLPWWSLTHAEHRGLYLGIPHPGIAFADRGEAERARSRVPPAGRSMTVDPDPDYERDG